jgi:hypothetical protein
MHLSYARENGRSHVFHCHERGIELPWERSIHGQDNAHRSKTSSVDVAVAYK